MYRSSLSHTIPRCMDESQIWEPGDLRVCVHVCAGCEFGCMWCLSMVCLLTQIHELTQLAGPKRAFVWQHSDQGDRRTARTQGCGRSLCCRYKRRRGQACQGKQLFRPDRNHPVPPEGQQKYQKTKDNKHSTSSQLQWCAISNHSACWSSTTKI